MCNLNMRILLGVFLFQICCIYGNDNECLNDDKIDDMDHEAIIEFETRIICSNKTGNYLLPLGAS